MLKHSKKIMNILIAVDVSGSMQYTKDATIKSINDLVKTYAEKDIKAEIELVLFNDEVKQHCNLTSLKEFKLLDNTNYVPNGMTAIYDAFGSLITKHKNSNRDTILVLLTDGQENSSRSYNQLQISNMIKEVQDEYDWEVVFLGSNITNFNSYASSLNIKAKSMFNFADTFVGRSDAVNFASASLNSYSTTRGYMSTSDMKIDTPLGTTTITGITNTGSQ